MCSALSLSNTAASLHPCKLCFDTTSSLGSGEYEQKKDGRGREEKKNKIQRAGVGYKKLMEGGNNRLEMDQKPSNTSL